MIQEMNQETKHRTGTEKGHTRFRKRINLLDVTIDHINTEYQEIDEFSEKKNESTFLNASGCFEIESNFFSTCPSINNVSRLPSNTSCGQQLPINKCSEIDHSDAYLQPLSGYEKQHAKNADEIQSCDDVLE